MTDKSRIQNSEFRKPHAFCLNPEPRTLNPCRRPAFTLTEMLIVMAIIAILSGLGLSAYSGAIQMGREQRTRAQIEKIDQLLAERYESYRTRSVPIKMPTSGPFPMPQNRNNALLRLLALRAIMRMEMPDRRTDIVNYANPPTMEFPGGTGMINFSTNNVPYKMQAVALQKAYIRRAVRALGGNPNAQATWTVLDNWTAEHEGAECLYLIVSTLRDGDKAALDYFSKDEIGDVDEDGMNEILDGWGQPIEFLRWAPGYCEQPGTDGGWGVFGVDDDGDGATDNLSEFNWPGSDDGVSLVATMQTRNSANAPDQFDPARVDVRWTPDNAPNDPYALHPLIISSGPDKAFDIQLKGGDGSYRAAVPPALPSPQLTFPNDPYYNFPSLTPPYKQLGTPWDENLDGTLNYNDNITNHDKTSQ